MDEKKTGENILKNVQDILQDFNTLETMDRAVFVTDNGANVVAAFKSFKRLSCACHNLNLVMDDVIEKNPLAEVKALIDCCKSLVKYFKHSQLNSKLSKTLKQQVKTRWNSTFFMLLSIFDVKEEIKTLLLKKDELQRISNLDFSLLENILCFLKPFKDCSEALSSDKEPTMQIFALWSEKLCKLCRTSTLDSQIITEFKTMTLSALEVRFLPAIAHLVGLFLNPPYKEMNFLSEEKRENVLATVKAMLSEFIGDHENSSFDDITNKISPNNSENGMFAEFSDLSYVKKRKVEKNAIDIELDKYLATPVAHGTHILEFWKNARDLKYLPKLARTILAIPASSSTSERLFSTSGHVLNEKRTRLKSTNLEKILFLNKNMT